MKERWVDHVRYIIYKLEHPESKFPVETVRETWREREREKKRGSSYSAPQCPVEYTALTRDRTHPATWRHQTHATWRIDDHVTSSSTLIMSATRARELVRHVQVSCGHVRMIVISSYWEHCCSCTRVGQGRYFNPPLAGHLPDLRVWTVENLLLK